MEDAASAPDFRDVRGQTTARRALEVAAAGGHNVLMIGPPGSGKTMLAKRMAGILPQLTFQEAIETTKIHSIAGLLRNGAGLLRMRPFRAPHHTISDAGMVGGGLGSPRPGEVSFAHHGLLFLDEFPEFPRDVLENLRQPLEDGSVTISRSNLSLCFPSSFMLVAAMNPCRCGFYGDATRECRCTPAQIQRYLGKIAGPLLDRIDIHIEVPAVPYKELRGDSQAESSAEMRARVERARADPAGARVLQLAYAVASDSQAMRAGRFRRADARNGRAAHGAFGARARPGAQGRTDHRGFGGSRRRSRPSMWRRRCSIGAWIGIIGIEQIQGE